MSDNSLSNQERELVAAAREQIGRLNLIDTPPSVDAPERLGDYEIHEEIGRGGMGTVFRATHVRLKRTVALKVLAPQLLDKNNALTRFLREIEAIGKLPQHRNVVLATDARQVDNTHFLVMEYVEGCDLGKLVRRSGPLRSDDACEIIRQAAEGLHHISQHGLVHRDLKASNLMLTTDGVVKILDLGLARFSAHDAAANELTQLGQCVGTADYMAPEQWENCAAVDARADLYSLGCTLFFLLDGRPPFAGPRHDTIFKKRDAHLRELPLDLAHRYPDMPREISVIVSRLLSKQATERIATPRLLAETLQPLTKGADLITLYQTAIASDEALTPQTWARTETINDDSATNKDDVATKPDRLNAIRGALVGVAVLIGLTVIIGGAIALTRDPTGATVARPNRSAVDAVASDLTLQSRPSAIVREAYLWVRRSGDDASAMTVPLVLNGQLIPLPPLAPIADGDDFNMRVEFYEPRRWELVWLDTSGKVTVAARSEQPSAVFQYPGHDTMVSVDPADPPGLHLLLLLVCSDQRQPPDEAHLENAFATLGPPPRTLDAAVGLSRGPGEIRKTLVLEKQDYLQRVTENLPAGLRVELPLFLPAD